LGSGDLAEADGRLAIAAAQAERLGDVERRRYEFGRNVVLLARARLRADLDGIEGAAAALAAPDSLVLTGHQTERRRALVLGVRAAVAAWRGELDAAAPMLEETIDVARTLGLADCEFDALSMLALVHAVRGELKRAARLAGAALAFSDRDRDRWRTSPHLAPAHAALAICAFEWGDAE